PNCWQLADPLSGPMEWELEGAEEEILALIHESAWDDILKRASTDWGRVVVTERPVRADRLITALVRFPLSPEWKAKSLGRVVLGGWREDAAVLRGLPPKFQRRRIQQYRDIAADPTRQATARRLAAARVEYYEEQLRAK